MCGISGFFVRNPITERVCSRLSSVARSTQSLRGPDSFGSFANSKKTVGLFHNRLSLLDLTSAGNQPMTKHGLTLVFNGEVYNFREIKLQLMSKGYVFSSQSDTEVILSSFDAWGEDCINRFNGAFAFAIYNHAQDSLTLYRDRVGEKPLYFFLSEHNFFYFSSSVEFIKKSCSNYKFTLSRERILSDLVFNFWSDKSATHFEQIFLLEPGHSLRIDNSIRSKKRKYWDLSTNELEVSEKECISRIDHLILSALEDRVTLDTEIGSILSGGIDSSLLTVLAQEQLNYPIQTFTLKKLGFVDEDLASARRIAQEEDWIHHEVSVRKTDISLNGLLKVTKAMEEPALDQVYIYINRNYEEVRRRDLKAVINGQASDEIFLGYLNYYPFLKNTDNFKSLISFRDYWYDSFPLKEYINKNDVISSIESNLAKNFLPYQSQDALNTVLRFGVKTHMPELLIQEDKQAMASSVEVRTVYSDYRLVEYLSQVPSTLKMKDGREKYLLRKVAQKYLPDYILNRKKLGFPDLPDGRQLFVKKYSQSKLVQSSDLLHELFSGALFSSMESLPTGLQWKIISLAMFERENL